MSLRSGALFRLGKIFNTKICTKTASLWPWIKAWKTAMNQWMGHEWMDSLPHALFFFFFYFPTLYSVPNLSLPVSAKPETLLAAGSAAHLLASSRVKQTEIQNDGLDLSWAARSSRWQGNKQVRCLWWNGLNKTNRPHSRLEESSFCSITQPCIKCDNLKQVAKWLTMAPLELGWRRSFWQSG